MKTCGFTLLEVLISLVILTVGSTCVVALYSAAMETYRRSQLEFLSTNAGMEILDTAEDLLSHGISPQVLDREVKKRVDVPRLFFFDVTCSENADGSIGLSVSLRQEGRGKIRTWTWRRDVVQGTGTTVLPIPTLAPKRYK